MSHIDLALEIFIVPLRCARKETKHQNRKVHRFKAVLSVFIRPLVKNFAKASAVVALSRPPIAVILSVQNIAASTNRSKSPNGTTSEFPF
jgi:hypothetical protein